jgi:hypothetical protein
MDYEITPSTDGKFIAIKIQGDIARQDAMRVNLEARARQVKGKMRPGRLALV